MPRYLFSLFHEQFLGIQQIHVCVKTVALSSQVQITFQEPVSKVAGRNPGLRLAESFAQLGCEWGTAAPGACTWMLQYQLLNRCTLALEKDHELTHFVRVKE